MEKTVAKLKKAIGAARAELCNLQAKAELAKRADVNGASMNSIAEKLGWTTKKVEAFFDLKTDIEIRDLSDMAFALGTQVQLAIKCPSDQVVSGPAPS